MDRNLTDDEINELQNSVRDSLTDSLKVELR
jgi:phenylalanyl-tRNA synthetase beta subunit